MSKRGASKRAPDSKQVVDASQMTRPKDVPRRSRIERVFAGLGLSALTLIVLVGVLLLDVALAPPANPLAVTFPQTWDMNLVTNDGREIGGIPMAYTLALSPVMHFENYRGGTNEVVSINSLGCRGPEPVAERATCAIVGGSAAFGYGLYEKNSFAGQLQARFPTINVVNGGVVGYLSEQELALAFFKLERLKPKLYIAFNGWNDAYDGAMWYESTGRPHPAPGVNSSFGVMQDRLVKLRGIETDPWQGTVAALQSFARRSRLIGLIAGLVARDGSPASAENYPEEQLQGAIDAYVSNMLRLNTLATERGGKLIVVLQPAADQLFDTSKNPQVFGQFPKEIYARFRREAAARLEGAGVRVIDANEYLAANGVELKDFIDIVHLSPTGHARIAQLLASEVAEIVPQP